jgi:hypothetical protein
LFYQLAAAKKEMDLTSVPGCQAAKEGTANAEPTNERFYQKNIRNPNHLSFTLAI